MEKNYIDYCSWQVVPATQFVSMSCNKISTVSIYFSTDCWKWQRGIWFIIIIVTNLQYGFDENIIFSRLRLKTLGTPWKKQ